MERKGKSENFDPQVASSNSYNDLAGAQKNLQVGPKLQPIKLGTEPITYTTDASTARQLPKGTQLAIYNNSGTLGAITFSNDPAVTALAAGVTDSAGHVGLPLKANDWSYFTLGKDAWFRTTANTSLVYIIDDHTQIK
jgi:hypothetical protein